MKINENLHELPMPGMKAVNKHVSFKVITVLLLLVTFANISSEAWRQGRSWQCDN